MLVPAKLDYLGLLKAARLLVPDPRWRSLRIALLGDCALQQLVPLIRVLLAQASINAKIYEGDYDTSDAEVYNPASALYAFRPEVAVFFDSSQHVRDAFLASDVDRPTFAARCLDRITNRWDALERNTNATIVQSNLVMPYERFFGNYEQKVEHSLSRAVAEVNRGLAERARARRVAFINDLDFLSSYIGRRTWFDEKLWCIAKSLCAADVLPLVARNIAEIILASRGAGVKCLVVDLDNTLWGGVIGDDGLEGIRIGHLGDGEAFLRFQSFMSELARRGILLTVCSKNDRENALRPFREHPDMVLREKDITMFVANWDDKAKNIALIKETLNISYDSMVFLDDNPFERNLVRQLLPEVVVPELPEDPADYVKAICELNLFETSTFSNLDGQRSELYRGAAKREEVKQTFATIEDYLKSLDMQIELRPFSDFNLPRIAQLIQRSNQFNLATRRYSEAQCAAIMRDPASYGFTAALRDRFGDYGLISVVVVRAHDDTALIDEYLMSCRVLQRGVEQHVMNHIFEFAVAQGLGRVEGVFIPTRKNGMVVDFYRSFGFQEGATLSDGGKQWSLATNAYQSRTTFIRSV